MKIVSLDPAITDLIHSLNQQLSLVSVTSACVIDEKLTDVARINVDTNQAITDKDSALSLGGIDLSDLADIEADIVLARCNPKFEQDAAKSFLTPYLPRNSKLRIYNVFSFESLLSFINQLAEDLDVGALGVQLSNRLKAQAMDWGSNFYPRTKNKKVSLIADLTLDNQIGLYGLWVPDLVALASCHTQSHSSKEFILKSKWIDLLNYKPDVIIVAPYNADLNQSFEYFKKLEKMPDWDKIPAVKRGEVIFSAGKGVFDRPSLAIRDALAILFSAIAGFESGYITERDSFQRLRWLELHRHKLNSKI